MNIIINRKNDNKIVFYSFLTTEAAYDARASTVVFKGREKLFDFAAALGILKRILTIEFPSASFSFISLRRDN